MTKLTARERKIIKEAELAGGVRNLPSASFIRGKYRYARTTTGYARHLLTRDRPRRGRNVAGKISAKEFVRAWKRKK